MDRKEATELSTKAVMNLDRMVSKITAIRDTASALDNKLGDVLHYHLMQDIDILRNDLYCIEQWLEENPLYNDEAND